jgi:hypothetical protein
MDINNQDKQESSIPSTNTFSLTTAVKKCKNTLLKERLRTLIRSNGLSEREFYHSINLTRQYWYGVSWGIMSIPFELKLKIAKALNVDTSIIWQKQNESSFQKDEPLTQPKSGDTSNAKM